MKYIVLTLILSTLTNVLYASPRITELELNDVFVVPKGYDTNDNVELTFLTKLPSACYSPSKYTLTKSNSKKYSLKFFIKRKEISGCDETNLEIVKVPVYYSQTISLGELNEGNYLVEFKTIDKITNVGFTVTKATSTTMDDMEYAPVSNAFIPEMIYATSDAQVILSGVIQSSCMDVFSEDISVSKEGNVFVIVPKAKSAPYQNCLPVETPLQKIVSLGEIVTPGAYLIHVRSQSGLSVNKVFQVREKAFDPTGR